MAPPVRRPAGRPAARTAAPAASLLPENAGGGFEVPEGDYLWKDIYAGLQDYNGTVVPGEPAIFLVLESLKGKEEFHAEYLAGKGDFITPSEDGSHFVHPDGESTPQFFKMSDAIKLLKSLLDGGYDRDTMDGDPSVFQFKGLKAHMIPVPRNPGKGKQPDPNKTIPVVEKILAMPGAKVPVPTRGTAGARPTARTGAASRTAQRATQQDNGEPEGDLDAIVLEKVQDALTGAGDAGLARIKLASTVWMVANKDKDPDASNYRKMAGDKQWLEDHAEEGGWQLDGDQVTLA